MWRKLRHVRAQVQIKVGGEVLLRHSRTFQADPRIPYAGGSPAAGLLSCSGKKEGRKKPALLHRALPSPGSDAKSGGSATQPRFARDSNSARLRSPDLPASPRRCRKGMALVAPFRMGLPTVESAGTGEHPFGWSHIQRQKVRLRRLRPAISHSRSTSPGCADWFEDTGRDR